MRLYAERRPDALVGFIAFAGHPLLVKPPVRIGEGFKELKAALEKVEPYGGTNLGDSLAAAEQPLSEFHGPYRKIVTALTDGDSNCGQNPIRVAARMKEKGIKIRMIGIGKPGSFNERDLKKIASEGEYYYIANVPDLVEKFESFALRSFRS